MNDTWYDTKPEPVTNYNEISCVNPIDDCYYCAKTQQIEHELKKLGLDQTNFKYCLDEIPSDIFSEAKFLVFTLTHTCYCYNNFDDMKQKILYIYVKAENYDMGQRITYGKIFYEIEKQVNEQYKELAEKYNLDVDDLYCNHKFMEWFDKKTLIQYEIVCGS